MYIPGLMCILISNYFSKKTVPITEAGTTISVTIPSSSIIVCLTATVFTRQTNPKRDKVGSIVAFLMVSIKNVFL